MSATITPEVGKRYVTRGGWVTPPLEATKHDVFRYGITINGTVVNSWTDEGREDFTDLSDFDLISEYVEPTPTAPPDTFRRDLIARLYCELVMSTEHQYRSQSVEVLAESAISIADTLIEAMEASND